MTAEGTVRDPTWSFYEIVLIYFVNSSPHHGNKLQSPVWLVEKKANYDKFLSLVEILAKTKRILK
jgi:hypothetical protein